MIITIWLIMGVLGVLIYNYTLKYESRSIKYFWNILVFLCGGFGLLTGFLTWLSSKIK
jgi:hypothetical protein